MPSLRRGTIQFSLDADYVGDAGVSQDLADLLKVNLGNGTGTNQANRCYQTSQTISASGSYTLNLSLFTDNIGNACALTKVVAIFITHRSTSIASSGVTVGGGTNPLFGSKVSGLEVLPGNTQPFVFREGYAVSSGSADRLRIVNTDSVNPASVLVTILGSQ